MAQTISQFITDNRITMRVERTDRNPHMADSDRMDHWRVTLRANGRRMTLVFSQGYGHNGAEPELASVLDCLASDASGIENASGFEDWAAEYGYDTDSRKAEKTFKTCERQATRLRALLGDEAFDQLLWQTERE